MQKQNQTNGNGKSDFTPAERAVIDAAKKDLGASEPHGDGQRANARRFADAVLAEKAKGTELHAAIQMVYLGALIGQLTGFETPEEPDLG